METVIVPLTLDSVAEINCPYCECEKLVEPDANYNWECEGCGKEFKIKSMI